MRSIRFWLKEMELGFRIWVQESRWQDVLFYVFLMLFIAPLEMFLFTLINVQSPETLRTLGYLYVLQFCCFTVKLLIDTFCPGWLIHLIDKLILTFYFSLLHCMVSFPHRFSASSNTYTSTEQTPYREREHVYAVFPAHPVWWREAGQHFVSLSC